ncbi:MAG TPA: outer membrane protein transport protein [Gemmatimonadaceae bacterium]
MRLARAATCAIAVLLCSPGMARSQGFQLNEVGTCAVARGQAVTGATCGDPSVIYWNPAATTSLPGWSAYLGVASVSAIGSFTADTTGREDEADAPVEFPPHLFVNYTNRDQRWSAGVGAYVPYGLTTQWRQDFSGRFAAQKASLQSIYIQPNFAYRFAEGWSIGGGPVFGHSTVELRQGIDLAAQQAAPDGPTFGQLGFASGIEFGRAKLRGSATAWGFNVGIHGQVTPNWQVGVRYLSQLTFDYDDADATFQQIPTERILASGNPLGAPPGTSLDALLGSQFAPGAPLSARKVTTRIKHPAQLQAGLGYSGITNTVLSADFAWSRFSAFDRLPVNFQGDNAPPDRELIEDYEDSWSLRASVEHAFAIGIKGRAGFNYIRTPAPDATVTPLLPDMSRRNLTIGVGVPLTSRYTLDAAYLRVDTDGRRGRIQERTSTSQTAADLNSGFYTLNANVWSLSVRANF